jgi:endonuclease YncB( thermonuclease family)
VKCGIEARDALVKQFGEMEWTCRTTGKQTYGRGLATCFVDNEDANRWIVLNGCALSFRRYKHPYNVEEQRAHDQCTGMRVWSFHAPWD